MCHSAKCPEQEGNGLKSTSGIGFDQQLAKKYPVPTQLLGIDFFPFKKLLTGHCQMMVSVAFNDSTLSRG